MFEKIKKWHKHGLWTSEMVHNALTKGVITEKQEKEIVKEV